LRFNIYCALLLSTFCARRAAAFADAAQFFKSVPNAATLGATSEGLYFTGAPRFVSQSCASCHIDAPGLVDLKLGADDQTLFTNGYHPGQIYELEVSLSGETRGLDYSTPTCTEPPTRNDKYTYVQCNNNGFALEIDAADGPLAGPSVFCAAAPNGGQCPAPDPHADEALVSPDGDAVFHNRPHSSDPMNPKLLIRNDATFRHLWWTAPAAGTGPLTLYVAAVDGNGGDGTADSDQDPYRDDTVQASFFIQEAGGQVPNGATTGCSLIPAGASARLPVALLALVLVVPLLAARRVRARSRAGAERRARTNRA
jgi:hypothetical protein